jgi:hypothetical protein
MAVASAICPPSTMAWMRRLQVLEVPEAPSKSVAQLGTSTEKKIFGRPLDLAGGSRSHRRSLARFPVVGRPMTNLHLPPPPLDDSRPAPPSGCPARPLCHRRADLLVRGFFEGVCSISACFPLFFYGGIRRRRPMGHHRHVPRWHHHTAARRGRAHRSGGADRRGDRSQTKQVSDRSRAGDLADRSTSDPRASRV